MPYKECKIYHDGSHYIAIPYRPNHAKRRPKPTEELISVAEESDKSNEVFESSEDAEKEPVSDENEVLGQEPENDCFIESSPDCGAQNERKITRKELFEELYEQTKNMSGKERRKTIENKMRSYFGTDEAVKAYVAAQFERKIRNNICRRIRLTRKVNLANFNFFVTFTYDSAKHTEDSFKRKLKIFLRNMTFRKRWRYAGVWERSPGKNRLHFHGLFEIPEGTMPGEFQEINDYNTTKHRRQTAKVNSYILEHFGRNDFKEIDSKATLGEAIAYLTKYMEKTGEKIVYSKNLPQFFLSDIMEDDIVCTTGVEGRKFVLFDDFKCWDEGCYMGQVSSEVIKQMRKVN